MNIRVSIAHADPGLRTSVPALRRVLISAVRRVHGVLALSDLDIVVLCNPGATIPEIGIGGYTPTAHLVMISLDPHHRAFRRSLRTHLPRTVAHELHHAARWNATGYGQTLGEALVTEGLAAHFEHEVFGGKPNPWDVALRGAALRHIWRRASREIGSSSYDHNTWFFGSKPRKIPKWTGYTLGFEIVGRYLNKHPSERPSVLVKAKASKFLP